MNKIKIFWACFFQHNHFNMIKKFNNEKYRIKNLLSTFVFPFEIGVYLAT